MAGYGVGLNPEKKKKKKCVASLGQEDPLEKVPWTEGPGGLQTMGPQRVGHDRMIEHIEQSKKKKKKKKKQISTLKYYSYLKWVKTKLGVDD